MTYQPILIDGLSVGPYAGQRFANLQPFPLNADTADFTDFGDRTMLSSIGVFSADARRHRAKRDRENAERLMYENAYRALGLDRAREHGLIAAAMETASTNGVWAKSTGEYARRCHDLDRVVAARVYERIV